MSDCKFIYNFQIYCTALALITNFAESKHLPVTRNFSLSRTQRFYPHKTTFSFFSNRRDIILSRTITSEIRNRDDSITSPTAINIFFAEDSSLNISSSMTSSGYPLTSPYSSFNLYLHLDFAHSSIAPAGGIFFQR